MINGFPSLNLLSPASQHHPIHLSPTKICLKLKIPFLLLKKKTWSKLNLFYICEEKDFINTRLFFYFCGRQFEEKMKLTQEPAPPLPRIQSQKVCRSGLAALSPSQTKSYLMSYILHLFNAQCFGQFWFRKSSISPGRAARLLEVVSSCVEGFELQTKMNHIGLQRSCAWYQNAQNWNRRPRIFTIFSTICL